MFWEEHLKGLKKSSPGTKVDDAYRKKWEAQYPLSFFEHRFQFGPNGTYGKWIRSHNAVIKINDIPLLSQRCEHDSPQLTEQPSLSTRF